MIQRGQDTSRGGRQWRHSRPPSKTALEEARARLAQRMVELRGEANLSIRQAARRAGIDQRNWGRMEKAETNLGLEALLRIQYAFELDNLEALLGRLPAQELVEEEKSESAGS